MQSRSKNEQHWERIGDFNEVKFGFYFLQREVTYKAKVSEPIKTKLPEPIETKLPELTKSESMESYFRKREITYLNLSKRKTSYLNLTRGAKPPQKIEPKLPLPIKDNSPNTLLQISLLGYADGSICLESKFKKSIPEELCFFMHQKSNTSSDDLCKFRIPNTEFLKRLLTQLSRTEPALEALFDEFLQTYERYAVKNSPPETLRSWEKIGDFNYFKPGNDFLKREVTYKHKPGNIITELSLLGYANGSISLYFKLNNPENTKDLKVEFARHQIPISAFGPDQQYLLTIPNPNLLYLILEVLSKLENGVSALVKEVGQTYENYSHKSSTFEGWIQENDFAVMAKPRGQQNRFANYKSCHVDNKIIELQLVNYQNEDTHLILNIQENHFWDMTNSLIDKGFVPLEFGESFSGNYCLYIPHWTFLEDFLHELIQIENSVAVLSSELVNNVKKYTINKPATIPGWNKIGDIQFNVVETYMNHTPHPLVTKLELSRNISDQDAIKIFFRSNASLQNFIEFLDQNGIKQYEKRATCSVLSLADNQLSNILKFLISFDPAAELVAPYISESYLMLNHHRSSSAGPKAKFFSRFRDSLENSDNLLHQQTGNQVSNRQ